jgi:DegV family protein with EDD domain
MDMRNYQIITDSGADLPMNMLSQLDVKLVSLSLLFRGQTLADSVTDETKTFYEAMRAGESTSTSAVNPDGWANVIEPVLQEGKDALIIAFSSGLSTTYQSAVIAADELKEKYPERNIRVVDSLCASLGQGLLVWYACRKRDAGMELNELADWVETTKWNLCHWFTVDDLKYLKRGGRISAATALVGTMLNIKPVLHVDDGGHLVSVSKVRGRKTSIEALAQQMEKLGFADQNDAAFICHGDCLEDAQHLAKIIKERCGVKEVFIGYTGAVIGSHSGPGTLALFFLGQHR